MSSSNRATSKGGKSTKAETTTKSQKSEKTDTQKIEKNKSGKGSGDKNQVQQNSDSIRNAKYKDLRTEDPSIKEIVCTVIELTQRSEEDVCFALHECGFDCDLAVNMLLESSDQEWVTSVKKKKNRQAASTNKTEGNTEGGADEWQESAPAQTGNEREKSRTRGGGPPRMRGRGWRGRENRENEKNLDGEGGRRGGRMSNGPTRGGGSGRGGRGGGRLGSRTFQSRDGGSSRGSSRPTMDTWNNATAVGQSNEPENWNNDFPSPIDDWYNEEYTGSLTETKVFTPSTMIESTADQTAEKATVANATPTTAGGEVLEVPSAVQQPPASAAPSPALVGSGSLTAAQSQYLSQLTQQNSVESVKPQPQQQPPPAAQQLPYNTSPVATYNTSNYSGVSGYGNMQEHSNVQQTLPTRTKTQRARVPPPSKIPASAVEMPGDLNSNVSYLDVQFGALDFMDGNSFDGVTDKFSASNNLNMDNSAAGGVPASNLDLNVSQASTLDGYTTSPPKPSQVQQSSISSALSQSQMLSNPDTVPQADISGVSGSYAQSRSAPTGSVPPPVSASTLDIGKAADVGHNYTQPQPNSYQTYQSQKSSNSVYQSQNYNSNNFQSSSQVASTSTYGSSQQTNSYVNSNSASYNSPSAPSVNSYQNNSYSSNSSYQTATGAAFPSISQPSASFSASANSQTSYQPSTQSVYGGASSGLSNSSNYNVTNSQYNNYNASSSTNTHNHKISSGKDQSAYDNTTTSSSTVTAATTTSVSASPALGLTNSQTSSVSAGTKVTTSSAAKSGIVTNIPPGVAPMMGTQYIMGQAGMPFYQQPMYSYEDLQMLQQRVPPHMGAYYDISYQTPTTLATAREGSIASGAYSMSDSRFTRDNNASPVPSTLSQQTSTQSHQAQPMLSATLPPGYAYFYNAAGMMPGSFQYGTPAIYPQMPAATNAHGSTNLSQYPKPSNYGSGYGSGYDALSQSQDYAKTGYVSGTQTQSKAGGVGANAVTTGSSVSADLSVMYGKSHAALGKVNSYEKQGFHSGTPPPFNLAGNQSAGIAPSGTYGPQMYIPTMPQQHHHSTTLMHQPLHQMDMRHQARRMDSANSSGQRSQSSSQAKSGAKQSYPTSYWNPA